MTVLPNIATGADAGTRNGALRAASRPAAARAELRGTAATFRLKDLLPGIGALLAALPLAVAIHRLTTAFEDQPERGVQLVGLLFAALGAAALGACLVVQRRRVTPDLLTRVLLGTAVVMLSAVYLYWASFHVFLRADILIWSESDFVNDILKLRVGYPLFTDQANNESFTYVPGAQLLTYLLAWLVGHATSIPTYRAIQVIYTALAAIVGGVCCVRLAQLSGSADRTQRPWLWSIIWVPGLFLVASNAITNAYVQDLHDDALAQLVTVAAYWLLLEYVRTRSSRLLVLMALIPGAGFFVKQSLAVFAAVYGAQLTLFDRPRSLRRVVAFGAGAAAALAAVLATCYLLWGEPFFYWVFVPLGKHGVSPLRGLQHLLDGWAFFAIGLFGGYVLLRGDRLRRLLGPWLIWLGLLGLETYSSGIAYMLNHMGPGSLLGSVWFFAALPRVWRSVAPVRAGLSPERWLRAGAAVAIVGLLFSGLGVVRIPARPFSTDVDRYVAQIEAEFSHQPSSEILLDVGSWVYLDDGIVMQDRAPSIGERGLSQTGDFSGMVRRLEEQRYAKILVRNYHAPDFWYDHYLWPQSSGIRQAMQENYREVRRIAGVQGPTPDSIPPYCFAEISVLVPNRT